jgi:hypothetical protein
VGEIERGHEMGPLGPPKEERPTGGGGVMGPLDHPANTKQGGDPKKVTASQRLAGLAVVLLGAALILGAVFWIRYFWDRDHDRNATRVAHQAQITAEALTVPGRIASSRLSKSCDSSQYGSGGCWWSIKVDYVYEVNGLQYSGDQRWQVWGENRHLPWVDRFDQQRPRWDLSAAEKQTIRARYSPGAMVPVYYHPSNPSDVWLHPKALRDDAWWMVGIFFMFIGAGVLVIGVCITRDPNF